jgi:hypothetical protein
LLFARDLHGSVEANKQEVKELRGIAKAVAGWLGGGRKYKAQGWLALVEAVLLRE